MSHRRNIYVPDPAIWERISQAAEAVGESVSEYMLAAAVMRIHEDTDAPDMTPEEWRRISRRVEGALR